MIEDALTALGYGVSWQFWLIPGAAVAVGGFFLVSRFFGVRNGVYAAILLGLISALKIVERRAQQRGWDDRIKKEKRDADAMVDRAERAGRTVLDADPDRLRDDDGFKRR